MIIHNFGGNMVRLVEFCGIITFLGILAYIFFLLPIAHQLSWLLSGICFIAAYFVGDFISGIIHWICDSFGDSQTLIIGPMIIHAFRHHHLDPQKIVRETLVENLGASAIAGSLFLIPSIIWKPSSSSILQLFFFYFYVWTIVFGVISNLFHRWAHLATSRKNFVITLFQKLGLIISSEHHLRHHKPPFNSHYCILSGWANTISNRIPWRSLEKIIAKIGIYSNYMQQVQQDEQRKL